MEYSKEYRIMFCYLDCIWQEIPTDALGAILGSMSLLSAR